jgi:hypothetical protein
MYCVKNFIPLRFFYIITEGGRELIGCVCVCVIQKSDMTKFSALFFEQVLRYLSTQQSVITVNVYNFCGAKVRKRFLRCYRKVQKSLIFFFFCFLF